MAFPVMWSWLSLPRQTQLSRDLLRHITSIATWMRKGPPTGAIMARVASRDAPTTAWRANTASTSFRKRWPLRPVSVAEEGGVMWPSSGQSHGISWRKIDGGHINDVAT